MRQKLEARLATSSGVLSDLLIRPQIPQKNKLPSCNSQHVFMNLYHHVIQL